MFENQEASLPQIHFGGRAKNVRRVAMLAIHSSPLAMLGVKQAGGMNVYVRELAHELGVRGICVDIYTCAGAADETPIVELGNNVRVITLHTTSSSSSSNSVHWLLESLPELVRRIACFAGEHKISYDIIHSHYWLSGLVALELKRMWQSPVIHMFHTLGAIKNFVAPSAVWSETAMRLNAEEKCLREADCIVAATPLDKIQMQTYYKTCKARTVVIPCGVNADVFRPHDRIDARRQLGLPAHPTKLLLFVGRIEPLKGLDTLLRAVRLLHDTIRNKHVLSPSLSSHENDVQVIVIGGDGAAAYGGGNGSSSGDGDRWSEEEQRLRALAEELGITNGVRFLGAQQHERLPLYYSAADLLVAPSHYESFGLVALEAQACGTPVVASRVGGLMFTVRDGESGFLVVHNDAQDFARRINELLTNEHLRRTFSTYAHRNAQRFAWHHIAASIVELYEQTLARAATQRESTSRLAAAAAAAPGR